MSDHEAEIVWELILNNFSQKSWSEIETTLPDDWDLKMLCDIKTDPDCKDFLSSAETMKELGL